MSAAPVYGIKQRDTGLSFCGFGPGPAFDVLWGAESAAVAFSDHEAAECQAYLLAYADPDEPVGLVPIGGAE